MKKYFKEHAVEALLWGAALLTVLTVFGVIYARMHSYQDSDAAASLLQAVEVMESGSFFPAGWHGSTGIESQIIPKMIGLAVCANYLNAATFSSCLVVLLSLAAILFFVRFAMQRGSGGLLVAVYFSYLSIPMSWMLLTLDYYYFLSILFYLLLGIWLACTDQNAPGVLIVIKKKRIVVLFWAMTFAAVCYCGMRIVESVLLPIACAMAFQLFAVFQRRERRFAEIVPWLGRGLLFVVIAGAGALCYRHFLAPLAGVDEGATATGILSFVRSYEQLDANVSSLFHGLWYCLGCPMGGGAILSVSGAVSLARFLVVLLLTLVFPLLAALDYKQMCYAERTVFLSSWFCAAATVVLLVFGTPSPDPSCVWQADSRYVVAFVCPLMVVGCQYVWRHFLATGGLSCVFLSMAILAMGAGNNLLETHEVDPFGKACPHASSNVGRLERLTAFLEEKGLKYGYATFWNAGVNTLVSSGRVKIRQVLLSPNKLVRGDWLSREDWYAPSAHAGTSFMLLQRGEIPAYAPNGYKATALGEPDKIFEWEDFVVLVYPYNISENGFGGPIRKAEGK